MRMCVWETRLPILGMGFAILSIRVLGRMPFPREGGGMCLFRKSYPGGCVFLGGWVFKLQRIGCASNAHSCAGMTTPLVLGSVFDAPNDKC